MKNLYKKTIQKFKYFGFKLKPEYKKVESRTHNWVDFTNDSEMIREGLRAPKLLIDKTTFKKTEADKRLLKQFKRGLIPLMVLILFCTQNFAQQFNTYRVSYKDTAGYSDGWINPVQIDAESFINEDSTYFSIDLSTDYKDYKIKNIVEANSNWLILDCINPMLNEVMISLEKASNTLYIQYKYYSLKLTKE